MFYLKNNLNSWVDLTYLEPWTHWYCGCFMELCAGFHRLIYKMFVSYVLSEGNRVTYIQRLIANYFWGKIPIIKLKRVKLRNYEIFLWNFTTKLYEFSPCIDCYSILLVCINGNFLNIYINDCKCIWCYTLAVFHELIRHIE